ncbi:MAG: hypothetical protein Q7R30_17060 [Acidobacteriota bacterium]|nr:hypothetical protein [Acidobacteriota bacterium]
MIEQLPVLTPDAARAERVAARCRATLARHRQRIEAAAMPPGPRMLALERAMVLGFCMVYLSAIFLTALEMAGAR